jgi:hypothetical protein
MKLMESILKCYECWKTSSYEEVKIITHDGKKFWVCPNCDMEMPVVDKDVPWFRGERNKTR